MGAIGLPGDFSSSSRFVRAAFVKYHAMSASTEYSGVTQFFHILNHTAQPAGAVSTENGFEKTIYTSCCNTEEGIYYYSTYENQQITAISMRDYDLNEECLFAHTLKREQQIRYANAGD